MYILRVVIFSLDEPNLTRILTVFKENLVKYKGKEQVENIHLFWFFDKFRDCSFFCLAIIRPLRKG